MYISIDVGTTNLKMTLIDSTYQVHGQMSYRYANTHVTQTEFEMDIEDIWQGVVKGIRELSRQVPNNEKLAIILTTAMHSVILLKEDFEPVTPVFAWNDARGSEEIASLTQAERIRQYQRTGTPIHSMNPYFKVRHWLEQMKQTNLRIGSIKDVLYYRLTGQWLIDEASASAAGLYNVVESRWDRDSLKTLNIHEDQLPRIHPSKFNLPLKQAEVGLARDAIVYLGTTDGVASNYACRSLADSAVLTVGTSHAVRVISEQVKLDADTQNFCYHIQNGEYLIGYPSNNGGNVFEWIVDNYQTTFQELDEIASKSNTPEVTFLPFLNGERSPIWNDHAIAEILNIHRSITREQMLYSLLCGTFFNMCHNLEQLRSQTTFNKLCLVGGIVSSTGLVQLLANIIGMDIYVPTDRDAERLGSVALIRGEEVNLVFEKVVFDSESHQMLIVYYDRYQAKLKERYH